jgi:assimilatory nitrate reductase catalytic subunit
MFADGKFMHPDGKARFLPLTPRLPENAPTQEFPLVFNTGRVRDHWHTMTRTGKSAKLSAHVAEPYAEINTVDALRFKVRAGELATLRSKWGSMVVRVRTGADIPSGMVFSPIHWNRAFASDARVNESRVDLTENRAQAHAGVHEHFAASWYAVMLTRSSCRRRPVVDEGAAKFVRYEPPGIIRATGPSRRAGCSVRASDSLADVDWIEYRDPKRRIYRAAWFIGDRLEGCIYFDRLPALPERAWLARMFAQAKLDAPARASLMAGRALEGSDQGALVWPSSGNPRVMARELGAAATPAEIVGAWHGIN